MEANCSKSIINKIFIILILILLIAAIVILFKYLKYISKKPPKIEKYNECQWFIDGKSYFEDLFQKLMQANNTILTWPKIK